MNTTVIIPAYEPDEKMRTLVAQLKEKDFNILIIDDGSGDSFQPLFENLPAAVIHHPENKGKGIALKTGLSHVLEYYPDTENVITADADGQHPVSDILRVQD